MDIVPVQGQTSNQLLSTVAEYITPELVKSAYKAALRIHRNLPDIKKERNQARNSFERKMNMPKNKNGQATGGALVDVSYAGSGGAMPQRSITSSYPMGRGAPGGRSQRRGRGGRKGNNGPSRSLASKWDLRLNGLLPISNNLLNASSGQFVQAVNQTLFAATPQYSSVLTQTGAISGFFREFRIKRVELNFVPRVASTSTGSIGVCFDRDPRAGTVVSMSQIVRKNPYFEVDLKQPGSFVWTPQDEEDRRWRYTIDGGRPQESLSFGSILWFSQNDLANGAFIGDFEVTVDFEFAVLY